MPELERLREMDEKVRQLAGLYGAEKARADRVSGVNHAGDVVVQEPVVRD